MYAGLSLYRADMSAHGMVIMARLDMRKGTIIGKLGGMVGARWKETDYVRTLVTPTNPNTLAQQGVRTVFGTLIAWGKRIKVTVLDAHILPRPRNMTSLNAFIKFNKLMIKSGVYALENTKISSGSLPGISDLAAVAAAAANTVTVTWTGGQTGVALPTDPVVVVCYNKTQDTFAVKDDETRVDGEAVVSLAQEEDDVIHVFLFLEQGTSVTSDTQYATDVSE